MGISKTLSKLVILAILVGIFPLIVQARSLYVITDHEDSDVSAYKIDGDQVDYQIQMDPPLHFGHGAVGLALDPCSWTLFTSYDGPYKIGIINAKTLKTEKSIDTPVEFAGLAFDTEKQKLYCVQREERKLYVYLWNPVSKVLTLENYPTLENLSYPPGAYGLVLDEDDRILYVSDRTNAVKCYDANDPDFGYLGSINITVDSNDREAVGIDLYNDGQGNKYLYTGAWSHSTRHNYLVRTDISDVNNPSTEHDVGASATSVAVDQATGYIYITTSNNHIEVYNPSNWPGDPCDIETDDIDGPADIIVRGDVSYKPPLFYLEKTDVNEPNCVSFDDYITYRITYGPNSCDHNNVVLTDFLPDEVYYVSSSPDGNYNNVLRTVTWNIGPLDANTPNGFVTLTAKVDKCAESDGNITNYCVIESDIADSNAEYVTYLCSASSPTPACGEIVGWDINEFSLTWCPGHFAADVNGHEVYFGTNFNDVNDANNSWPIGEVYKGPNTNPSYPLPLGSLDKDTTYYWRIDEVNTAHPDTRWRGGVWSFKTGNYLVVDNFESYADNTALRAVWKKLSTKAIVAVNTDANYVHNGDQSMQYHYSNGSSPYYSEAYADAPNLPCGSDWSDAGLLRLYFYGLAGNDTNEQMYVKLTDGSSPAHTATVIYDGDPTDLEEESWHEWNIPLTAFTDINLADVKKIAIGFGDGVSSPAWSSYVFFDDIRLYLAGRCIPGYYPAGDFDSDCVVDFYDFAIFALSWLTNDPNISLDDDNDVDIDDLALFCDDWLWQESGEMSMSGGFGEPLCALPPPSGELTETIQQPQIELQPSPEPQPQIQSAPEPLQPEPQPQLQPEPQPQAEEEPEELAPEEIKEIIECLQRQLSDEQIKNLMIEEEGEQAWQKFSKMMEDWIEELKARL